MVVRRTKWKVCADSANLSEQRGIWRTKSSEIADIHQTRLHILDSLSICNFVAVEHSRQNYVLCDKKVKVDSAEKDKKKAGHHDSHDSAFQPTLV